MEYLLGSHSGGRYEHVFEWSDPLSMPYPPDGEVERQIPAISEYFIGLEFCRIVI
jgi:hypothetical protein